MESLNHLKGSEKLLILLRHGVTHPLTKKLSDFNRSLTEQGENSFLDKLSEMQNHQIFPECNPAIVISSPARRTVQTSQLFLDKLQLKVPFETSMNLYEQSTNCIQNSLESSTNLNESMRVVLVVAHNPLIESWAYQADPHFQKAVTPGTFLFFKTAESSWQKAILNPWSLFLHY